MKTKLLKRLRKEARKKFRIYPWGRDMWCVQEFVTGLHNVNYWHTPGIITYYNLTLEEAIIKIEEARKQEFEINANRLILARIEKRRAEKVKDL